MLRALGNLWSAREPLWLRGARIESLSQQLCRVELARADRAEVKPGVQRAPEDVLVASLKRRGTPGRVFVQYKNPNLKDPNCYGGDETRLEDNTRTTT